MQITHVYGPAIARGAQQLFFPASVAFTDLPEAAQREFKGPVVRSASYDLDDGRVRFGVNRDAILAGIASNGFYISRFAVDVRVVASV